MPAFQAAPSFGGRLNNDDYYTAVNRIISTLRPVASLRIIANHLTKAGFQTASGLEWNRHRVSDYIRNTLNKPTKESDHD
ncbi:hypothetical protein GTP45_01025 [Pseudoduganella sp. FT55W]|uniref:Recombinase domain-containing protein n=1 Tax=Duganella rivi TaxID=2666083 RepID=A0A7X4GMW0_9BURK|nr:hypothetical protein [Duganella rivi]MYM65414.1 hypothetical protein [Duganella rivi]